MTSSPTVEPNYIELVRFLVTPFLEFPESLVVDCETYGRQHKILVRLAFAASDKGRVFGRGGRTLQAIRTVLEASAKLVGKEAYLEVFGEREVMDAPPPPPRSSGVKVAPPRPRRKEDVSTEISQ